MRAERIVSIALWAYPASIRRSRGDEMTATVLDVSQGSRSALLRETLAFVYAGLSARAGIDPETTTRRMADICALAATIWGSVMLCISLGFDVMIYEAHMFGGLSTNEAVIVGLQALAIGSALLGYRRVAGISGLLWIGVFLESSFRLRTRLEIDRNVLTWAAHSVALILIPLCGYVVMLLAPDDNPRRHPSRLGWLAGVILLGIVVAPRVLGAGLPRFEDAILLVILIAGVVLLAVSTRPSLALALALAGFGMPLWTRYAINPGQQPEYVLLGITTLGPALLVALAATRARFTRKQLAR